MMILLTDDYHKCNNEELSSWLSLQHIVFLELIGVLSSCKACLSKYDWFHLKSINA